MKFSKSLKLKLDVCGLPTGYTEYKLDIIK